MFQCKLNNVEICLVNNQLVCTKLVDTRICKIAVDVKDLEDFVSKVEKVKLMNNDLWKLFDEMRTTKVEDIG